jgi:hypothetical protein
MPHPSATRPIAAMSMRCIAIIAANSAASAQLAAKASVAPSPLAVTGMRR